MLENKTIISTRPFCNDGLLKDLLREAGAKYISLPMIDIEINGLSPIEKNLFLNLEQFDWVIFTSINGVQSFFEHLESISPGKVFPPTIRTATVGHSTKNELRKFGIEASLVSSGKTAVDLLKHLNDEIPEGTNLKILLPLGNLAGDVLESGLKSKAQITRINVYKTIPPKEIDKQLLQKIKDNQYDLILLSSPSAFYNLKECLAPFQLNNLRFACIGPTTEKAVREWGVHPEVIAEISTTQGMYESVKKYFENNNFKN